MPMPGPCATLSMSLAVMSIKEWKDYLVGP